MRSLFLSAAALCVAAVGLAWVVWLFGVYDAVESVPAGAAPRPSPDLAAKGAYLARAGNCMLCHTRRGGAAYAGGRAIETPFGTVFSGNLTPDPATGIGGWTSAHFWRALHHGRSRDGRLLVPAFPYTSYTQVTREDADAIFAYLQSIAPVAQANPAHQLRWPYNTQWALALWRAIYFRPAVYQADGGNSAQWNRGAYLVRGLGHCSACHAARNLLGAVDETAGLSGGAVARQNWVAPSLLLASEAGVANWPSREIVALLRTGVAANASVTGPMADVVLHSTQFLSDTDLAAIAAFLRSMPPVAPAAAATSSGPPRRSPQGAKLFERHCAECHGESGEGVAGAYPALAGNRAVLMTNPANLVQIVLHGGFPPATGDNPRPFGMPPYQVLLGDGEVAEVLTFIRGAWGNQAAEVSELDVARHRAVDNR